MARSSRWRLRSRATVAMPECTRALGKSQHPESRGECRRPLRAPRSLVDEPHRTTDAGSLRPVQDPGEYGRPVRSSSSGGGGRRQRGIQSASRGCAACGARGAGCKSRHHEPISRSGPVNRRLVRDHPRRGRSRSRLSGCGCGTAAHDQHPRHRRRGPRDALSCASRAHGDPSRVRRRRRSARRYWTGQGVGLPRPRGGLSTG